MLPDSTTRLLSSEILMESDISSGHPSAELLQRAKGGDFSAFQALISHFQPRVYGLVFRILRQEQDAEDATQQTFLTLIEHLATFREESSLATWLLKVASNHAFKILRKKRGLKLAMISELSDGDGTDLPHPQFIAPWAQSPEQLALAAEVRRELDAALLQLDEKYRWVFILRDIEGLSVQETADLLDLTVSTVKVRLLRARLKLRERLTKEFGDPARVMIPDHQHA